MKKLNIPETNGQPTPEFVRAVKDNLEVIGGKRKNRITLPTLQADNTSPPLTFSNPPTQAECKALRDYVNAWAGIVQSLVARLDG